YNETNDLAVSTSSQKGGLSSLYTTTFPNQCHMGSEGNSDIDNEIIRELNINSSDNYFYTLNGFSPTTNNSHYKTTHTNAYTDYLKPGSIKINNPTIGNNFNPGDIIPINIS